METKIVVEKFDETAFEGDGGGYYLWTPSSNPMLSEAKLGASKVLLRPLGFVITHYGDLSKVGFVLEGSCKVGLVSPNSEEETVVLIKKGDVIPISPGGMSWWFNGGDTDTHIVFLGDTTKSLVPGIFTYFYVAGTRGLLAGFQPDIVGKTFDLDQNESEYLVNSQGGAPIVKLKDGTIFPEPSNTTGKKLFETIGDPIPSNVTEGGFVNYLTESNFPRIGEIGLSAKFVKLESNAMLAPSYVANGAVQMSYICKGSGRIRVVGSEGTAVLDSKVEEGDMFIIPQFLPTALIADDGGMDVFSIIRSSNPIVAPLAGKTSVWKAMALVALKSTLNVSEEFAELFKSKNTKSITIVPDSK